MRETNFSILKAFAIISVVLAHAGISGWISQFVYSFNVPLFFICGGYFFHTHYLNDERTYVVRRIRGLYFPFVRWSLLFLLLHNVFFSLGILSETYGNAQGGVLHPYNFQQFSQHFWSILFNMSGYDEFLGGAFWFFRAYFIASLAFLLLFKLIRRSQHLQQDKQAGWALLIVPFLLICWQISCHLHLTGVAQGGYRELAGLLFMAAGFLLRQYRITERLNWKVALASLLVLVLAATFIPASLSWQADFAQFLSLPITALTAFAALLYASTRIAQKENIVQRGLIYIGDHTLHIFAFHLLAFKVVSALKVAFYGLPWEAVGGHPVVTTPANNVIWVLLYLIAGIGLPLLGRRIYQGIAQRINITEEAAISYVIIGSKAVCHAFYLLLNAIYQGIIRGIKGFINFIKSIIEASNTKEE